MTQNSVKAWILGLCLPAMVALVGCAQLGEDSSAEVFIELSEEADSCMERWNSLPNFGQREYGAQIVSSRVTAGGPEFAYASFAPVPDSSGECEVTIAAPDIDLSLKAVTGGSESIATEQIEGFLYLEINRATISEVVPEDVGWNALIDSEGNASPGTARKRQPVSATPSTCLSYWNKSVNYASQSIVETNGVLGGEPKASVAPDRQFPDRCIVAVSWPNSGTAVLFKEGTESQGFIGLEEITEETLPPEYTTWNARVNGNGTLSLLDDSESGEIGGEEASLESDPRDTGGAVGGSGYPKFIPGGQGCGDIAITADSGFGLFDIDSAGASCDEVVGLLMDWVEQGDYESSISPEGWDCSISTPSEGMATSIYACRSGSKELSFIGG